MKNNIPKIVHAFIFLLLTTFIISCGSSTGTRYSKSEGNTEEQKEINSESETINQNKEDFDITPYKTAIEIPEKKKYNGTSEKNIWFDYGSPEIDRAPKSLVGTEDGYRVQVLVTDDLEEANKLKDDAYFSKSNNELYIDFEPPFYKVKVGDFSTQKPADDLKFKLNQLGYKEAKVIKDKINIFK